MPVREVEEQEGHAVFERGHALRGQEELDCAGVAGARLLGRECRWGGRAVGAIVVGGGLGLGGGARGCVCGLCVGDCGCTA